MIHDIVLGGGCFWGMEDLFRAQPGVTDTEVGYAGGQNENPTYDNHPGHAEALRVEYDDSKTSIDALLDYFFTIHDPTTLNRQGNDVGTSYRSVIFFANDAEEHAAKNAIERAGAHWEKPITTTLEPLTTFHSAEEYHQDYLQKNPGGYTCHYERSF
jgi:peptide-methionine (S)-S-oxide reductase